MNLLIAEDDKVTRKILRRILESESDYTIREATDGQHCWEVLNDGFKPDLCLFDIEMPHMTGLELLQKMRTDERFRDIPVLMITSKTDVNSKATAAALSSYAFVIKPFNPKKVLSLVHEAIQNSGKVFRPYGFEERQVVCEREGMDVAAYFKALVYFAEMLGLRLSLIEQHFKKGQLEQLLQIMQPLRDAAQQVGGDLFTGYFKEIEAAARVEAQQEAGAPQHGDRHIRILKTEYQELKAALETYLQVVIESDSRQKIVTHPDMTDWADESIRLSAEIEEHFFDDEGGFSLGNESILLRGVRGCKWLFSARLYVKNGCVVLSGIDGQCSGIEIDLSASKEQKLGSN